jgi:hypothetical protein
VEEQSHTVRSFAAFGFATFNLTDAGDPEQFGGTVTPSLFPLLRIKPVLGRSFADGEDRPGSRGGDDRRGLWKRRFGGDHHRQRHLYAQRHRRTVVGIAPASLAALWQSLDADDRRSGREIG